MDPDIFVSEDDRGANIITNRRDGSIVNEKTMSELIELLYETMKEETEHIDMISRRSLIELAESNLTLVMKIGIETMKNFMNQPVTGPGIASIYDQMNKYMNLFKEVIEKNSGNIDKTTYRIIATFVSDAMQNMITNSTNSKDTEKNKIFEKKTVLVSKLLIFAANAFFSEVLADIMQLFTPGNVPHRTVIELLTELASVYPVKAASTFQDVISRTLPILASIQNDEMRVIFSKLFAQVCESVIITIDSKANSNFQYDSLSHLLSTAYDLIYAQWMKDCKSFSNKVHIINSLIIMGALLPENSIRNNLEDIINLFINNLKKDHITENAVLSKSFRIFCETAVVKYRERIDMNVENLLVTICPILTNVNISPNVKDFSEEFIPVKSELLKITFILFKHYLEKTLTFLVSRFESIPLLDKLSNAYLIKIMLIRSDPISQGHRDMLISAISKATHEPDNEFKYSLFELINIMFEKEMITTDSCVKLISFLVKESGYTDEEILMKDENIPKSYPFYTNYKIIRGKAEYVLLDIINKIPDSEKYLWPGILEYFCDYKYDGSTFILCKMINCLKANIEAKMEVEKFNIDFVNSNLPTPAQILIKSFIILSNPTKRQHLSSVAIPCLKIVTPLLSPDLALFNPDANDLESYLKRGRYFDFGIFNDILLIIWEKCLNEIKSAEFLSSITTSIWENISKYSEDFITVGFLMRMQGLVLAKLNKRETIKNHLDNLFNIAHSEYKNEIVNGNVNQSQPCKEVRLGVGEAFGLCSKTNLDIVLDKINAIFKSEIQIKKATGIASFFTSSKDPELSPFIVTTLITSLGSIAKYADTSLLATRINSNFLSHIDVYFKNEKTVKILKYACMISLGRIFKALHKLSSFYIDKGDIFILQSRDAYLEAMIKIFKGEKQINEMKISALNNIAHLIQLDPPTALEQSKNFISLSFSILDCFKHEELQNGELHEKALDAMNNVLESILVHENHFTSALEKVNADVMIVNFEYLLNYDKDILTSWDFFSLIMEKFVGKYLTKDLNNPNSHEQIQTIIAERVNIFVNSKKSVKFTKEEFQNWVASLLSLLIFFFDDSNSDPQGSFISLSRLLTGLDVFDVNYTGSPDSIIDDLVKVFKAKYSKEDYLFIFRKLFYLLKINILSVNKHAAAILEKMLLESPGYFGTNEKDESYKTDLPIVEDVVEGLIKTLEFLAKEDGSVSSDRYINVLKVAEEFTKINLTPVVDACMKEEYGLPLPVSLTSIIQRLCKDKSLITKIFSRITDIINNGEPGFENKPNYMVCASTLILGTMLETHDPVIIPLIKKFFPQLLSTLLLRIGSSHSINYTTDAFSKKEEDPRNQTVWALQQLMSYFDEPELSTCLEAGGSIASKLLNTYEYDEGIYELMLIFCKKTDYNKQASMFEFLAGFLDRPWSGQRVVVVSCYAQFVNFASIIHIKNTDTNISDWRNNLITELTKTITDSDELARKQSIRGLANLCQVYLDCTVEIDSYIRLTEKLDIKEQITDEKREAVRRSLKREMLEASYGTSIINLLIEKLSDNSESVVLESLNSLQQMMEFLSIKAVIPCITNLLVKLRPCFDNHNHMVRSLGFNLFNRIISLVPSFHSTENSATDFTLNFGNDPKDDIRIEEIIKEQIHLHLVSLLLHTNDENSSVRNNCLKALFKAIIVIMGEDATKVMDDAKSKFTDYDKIYEEFIKTIVGFITEKYPNKIPFHISNCIGHSLSSQDSIRASSVHLVGIMYNHLVASKSEILKSINLENVFTNFSKLLKDFSPRVKIKTIKTLTFFKHVKAT